MVRSRSQMKKEMKDKKSVVRSNDDTVNRGFSTDQRISIESLNINRERLTHQKDETRLVGLSIQESAIGRQIASAEGRARERCPEYRPKNPYWKRVDQLLAEQQNVTDMMATYNNSLMNDNGSNTKDSGAKVSEFLNQPSPVKAATKRTFDDMRGDTSIIVFDDEDENGNDEEGLAVKLEMIEDVTQKGTVSRRSSKRRKRP